MATSTKKPPTDHLPSRKRRRQKTLRFVTDWEAKDRLDELDREIQVKRFSSNPSVQEQAKKLEDERVDLEAQVKKTSIKIVVQSMGRRAYEDLLGEHPPTTAQVEDFKKQGGRGQLPFNTDTYPMALIMASLTEPEPTDEVKEWLDGDDWTAGEIQEIFTACVSINSENNILELGKE